MKIKQLGENLFEIRYRWLLWSPYTALVEALLEIQGKGKTITAIYRSPDTNAYLICTK